MEKKMINHACENSHRTASDVSSVHAVCEMKMGYVKQDTWHVSILFV